MGIIIYYMKMRDGKNNQYYQINVKYQVYHQVIKVKEYLIVLLILLQIINMVKQVLLLTITIINNHILE